MNGKCTFKVGDIVTPKPEYRFGYGYYRFYRVLAPGNRFFYARPLYDDLSDAYGRDDYLGFCNFKLYRKGV